MGLSCSAPFPLARPGPSPMGTCRVTQNKTCIFTESTEGHQCGHTCPGPPTGRRLGKCLDITSSSCQASPPNTSLRGGGLLSPASGPRESNLCGSDASTLRPNTSPPEAPKPELINCSPHSGASKTHHKGQDASLPWGLTASVLPHMEPGLQAGHRILPFTILRPYHSHEVPSLSDPDVRKCCTRSSCPGNTRVPCVLGSGSHSPPSGSFP